MLVFLCFVSFVVHTVTCFWSLYCCCGLMAHRKYFLLFSLSLFPASLHLADDLSSFMFLIKKKCQSFCHPPCNYLLIPNFNSMLLVSKYPRSQELHVLFPHFTFYRYWTNDWLELLFVFLPTTYILLYFEIHASQKELFFLDFCPFHLPIYFYPDMYKFYIDE